MDRFTRNLQMSDYNDGKFTVLFLKVILSERNSYLYFWGASLVAVLIK